MNTLVISPHPDDEIIGCGGIIAKRALQGNNVYVCIVSNGCPPLYSEEYNQSEMEEMKKAHGILGIKKSFVLGFPSAMLDKVEQYKINTAIEDVVEHTKAEEVFIPHSGDIHKDHKIVSAASLVALRPRPGTKVKRVLSYEVLSETDWDGPFAHNAFIPNVYEDITGTIQAKTEAFKEYKSQIKPFPSARSAEAVKALSMHRGAVVGFNNAEAFMLIREIVR